VKILLTAFEPYEQWTDNSSWLTLVELLKNRPESHELVTRRYPVDLTRLRDQLYSDLQRGFDAVIHLGQCPGSPTIKLESLAINFAGRVEHSGQELKAILEQGPLAYRSQMPLGRWVELLRDNSIPASVSYHAGTFLCNATMFLSLHYGQNLKHGARVGFVHLPLATQQVANNPTALPSLPVQILASSVKILIEDLSDDFEALSSLSSAAIPEASEEKNA
jgi:pyroglutamyl-peptidase